ncbi:hypothetical protein ABIC37_005380 [Priestia megaterium]|uniref:hypothetical protein n=1 Tax=Priestia megaterium TaxID=1404 RepID=UPI003396CEA6
MAKMKKSQAQKSREWFQKYVTSGRWEKDFNEAYTKGDLSFCKAAYASLLGTQFDELKAEAKENVRILENHKNGVRSKVYNEFLRRVEKAPLKR